MAFMMDKLSFTQLALLFPIRNKRLILTGPASELPAKECSAHILKMTTRQIFSSLVG